MRNIIENNPCYKEKMSAYSNTDVYLDIVKHL